jgi:hypothetical protein
VRRKRIKSPISVVDIKRTRAAVQKAGLPIATLDVRPNGSIRVEVLAGAVRPVADVFEEWADRLWSHASTSCGSGSPVAGRAGTYMRGAGGRT